MVGPVAAPGSQEYHPRRILFTGADQPLVASRVVVLEPHDRDAHVLNLTTKNARNRSLHCTQRRRASVPVRRDICHPSFQVSSARDRLEGDRGGRCNDHLPAFALARRPPPDRALVGEEKTRGGGCVTPNATPSVQGGIACWIALARGNPLRAGRCEVASG